MSNTGRTCRTSQPVPKWTFLGGGDKTKTHGVGTGDEDGASGALDVIEGPCLLETEALVGPVFSEQGVGE